MGDLHHAVAAGRMTAAGVHRSWARRRPSRRGRSRDFRQARNTVSCAPTEPSPSPRGPLCLGAADKAFSSHRPQRHDRGDADGDGREQRQAQRREHGDGGGRRLGPARGERGRRDHGDEHRRRDRFEGGLGGARKHEPVREGEAGNARENGSRPPCRGSSRASSDRSSCILRAGGEIGRGNPGERAGEHMPGRAGGKIDKRRRAAARGNSRGGDAALVEAGNEADDEP
jgi:hypothetical protein